LVLSSESFYYLLFFLSGFPALLYQIVWQRALFTLYSVNIESVTMIVTVFMLGLGLGSLAGGRLSSLPRIRPLTAFGAIEISIGLFGAASLWIFLIPTLLMGRRCPCQHLQSAFARIPLDHPHTSEAGRNRILQHHLV
jgi:MFS family permease